VKRLRLIHRAAAKIFELIVVGVSSTVSVHRRQYHGKGHLFFLPTPELCYSLQLGRVNATVQSAYALIIISNVTPAAMNQSTGTRGEDAIQDGTALGTQTTALGTAKVKWL
jgi:hypothetical protein